ncbi:Hypothetical predicted protein [Mytilus galloprovincialis]|uniref:OTU domain-containing protein n=1 Tax=Mytilus galloprovincialis TaxID=29158 RepID=A0A8B6F1V7_MYTGA|nr:Hypothetical predicted protein [Mytilus galloprovincialis]
MGPPSATKTITGDGNCLFRAISYALSNRQEFFGNAIYLQHIGDINHYEVVTNVTQKPLSPNLLQCRQSYAEKYQDDRKSKVTAKKMKLDKNQITTSIYNLGDCNTEVLSKAEKERIKYWTDDKFRARKTYTLKRKYWENEEIRSKKLCLGIKKYEENETYRENLIQAGIKKYKEDEKYRDVLIKSGIQKYQEDPEYREMLKQASIEKYKSDENHKEYVKQASIQKYKGDKSHKEHVKQASIQKYADDDAHRIKIKQQTSVRRKNLQVENKQITEDQNIWYKDVAINNEWINPIPELNDDQVVNDESESDHTELVRENKKEEEKTKTTSSTTGNEKEIESEPVSYIDDRLRGVQLDTCLQPADIGQEALDLCFDQVFNIAPAENNSPLSVLQESGIEAKTFPVHFPTGKNTFDEIRDEKLTIGRYFNLRLMSVENRFARDTSYIFFSQYLTELNSVISNVQISLRKECPFSKEGKKITGEMLCNKETLKELFKKDEAIKYLKPIKRNSPILAKFTERYICNDQTVRCANILLFFFISRLQMVRNC